MEEQKPPEARADLRKGWRRWIAPFSFGLGVLAYFLLAPMEWWRKHSDALVWPIVTFGAAVCLLEAVVARRKSGRWRTSALWNAVALLCVAGYYLYSGGWRLVFAVAFVPCVVLAVMAGRSVKKQKCGPSDPSSPR